MKLEKLKKKTVIEKALVRWCRAGRVDASRGPEKAGLPLTLIRPFNARLLTSMFTSIHKHLLAFFEYNLAVCCYGLAPVWHEIFEGV